MREKWYMVTGRRGINSSLGTIDGIRLVEKKAYPGTIIPGEWFAKVSDEDFKNLFVDGYGAIAPYSPSADELPLLYTLYPATRPKTTIKAPASGGLTLKNKWYRVNAHDGLIYGIAALITVDGVCQAGDVAFEGDIIPSQWLAALSLENINRLERGVFSEQWLADKPRDFQGNYRKWIKPQLIRLSPSPMELLNLYARFPGANPNAPVAAEEAKDGQ